MKKYIILVGFIREEENIERFKPGNILQYTVQFILWDFIYCALPSIIFINNEKCMP